MRMRVGCECASGRIVRDVRLLFWGHGALGWASHTFFPNASILDECLISVFVCFFSLHRYAFLSEGVYVCRVPKRVQTQETRRSFSYSSFFTARTSPPPIPIRVWHEKGTPLHAIDDEHVSHTRPTQLLRQSNRNSEPCPNVGSFGNGDRWFFLLLQYFFMCMMAQRVRACVCVPPTSSPPPPSCPSSARRSPLSRRLRRPR